MEEKLLLRDHMRCTRLIQRLENPIGRASPFSFGGGLKNGGLSKEAMDVLGDIFNFDYMGSSEFEWGAVPAALNFIAEQSSLKTIVSGETQGVFYICPQSYETGVIAVIKALLDDEHSLHLKGWCGLSDRVNHPDEYNQDKVGWLELDNGFFFFVDKDMFEKTKALFEVS